MQEDKKGKRDQKKRKMKEKSVGQSDTSSTYVPGGIAAFLGSGKAEKSVPLSESTENTLASFFQPSTVKHAAPSQPPKQASNERLLPASKRKAGGSDDDEEDVPKRKRKRPVTQEPTDPAVLARTVFVGNLPVAMSKQELKGLFKVYGAIESIRFRSMGMADPSVSKKVSAIKQELNPKRNSFNAYVVFRESQCAKAALQSNGKLVNKHHLRVDIAGDNKKHDMKRSLFVGNLPFNLEDEELRNHFDEFGTVEGVRLIRDKATGVGKGFGYVLFEDSSSVKFALKMDGTKLSGRTIRVKRAVKKEKQKEQRDHRNPRGKFQPRKNSSNTKTGAASGARGYHGKQGSQKPQFKGKIKKKSRQPLKGKQKT